MSTNNMSKETEVPTLTSGMLNIGLSIVGSLSALNPIISSIYEILSAIIQIDDKAQYNKKISKSILGRVLTAEAAIKFLLVQKDEYEVKFADLKFQESLVTFKNILDKIKDFAEQVTQLRGIERLINAQAIEKNYKDLMEEYEACLNNLQFTMIVLTDEQRRLDSECLKSDIADTKKFMEGFANYHKEQTNIIYQEIKCIKNKLLYSDDSSTSIDVRTIETNLLKEPPHGSPDDRQSFDSFDNFDDLDPNNINNKRIKEEFKQLIERAWKQTPEERIGITELYLRLSELSSIIKKSPSLTQKIKSVKILF
ncbi:11866_t:CDS:2 [Scutellospora calospora]|uniref:11866_t:CDS:1 n=1 Tax=Scutellospora calospora TaxID=85575 RepID=A0ACA9JWP0_9GLOM|nr:11866_t:CDS:2 [Scutellospora calospora]